MLLHQLRIPDKKIVTPRHVLTPSPHPPPPLFSLQQKITVQNVGAPSENVFLVFCSTSIGVVQCLVAFCWWLSVGKYCTNGDTIT